MWGGETVHFGKREEYVLSAVACWKCGIIACPCRQRGVLKLLMSQKADREGLLPLFKGLCDNMYLKRHEWHTVEKEKQPSWKSIVLDHFFI